jgi:hypothetical protein
MLPRENTFLAGERGRFIGASSAPFALAVGTRSIPVFGQGDTFQCFHHAVEIAWWPRYVGHQHSTGQGFTLPGQWPCIDSKSHAIQC